MRETECSMQSIEASSGCDGAAVSITEESHIENQNIINLPKVGSEAYFGKELENDDRLFNNKEVRDIVDICLRISLMKEAELSKGQRIQTLNMVKNWFVGIKFIDEKSISKLGFVSRVLSNLDIEHPYERAQYQENIISIIKNEFTRCRHNIVLKMTSLIKGRINEVT